MADQGPLSNQVLGGTYLLGELLGQGGFGAVYKAQHQRLNRPQAIKVLMEQHFGNLQFRARFIREAQTLAALDYPNILHVDELGEEGNLIYLVMPFISRGTFQSLLKQRGPLPVDEAGRYLEQICLGLRYAHQRNVVHLDLKPLNLLVHEDGRLLLSDFGLAHLIKEGAVQGGSSLAFGTPLYMAPEHLRGQPDWRSDLYSVGVMLYQMLTGRLPFEGSTPEAIIMKLLTEEPPPLRHLRPDLPVSLEWMLAKALTKRPEERYQKASEFLYSFREATSPRPSALIRPPTHILPSPQPPAVPVRRPSAPVVPYPAVPPPVQWPSKRKRSLGGRLAAIGGAAALGAFFLPWLNISTPSFSTLTFSGATLFSERGDIWLWLEPIGATLLLLLGLLAQRSGKAAAFWNLLAALLGIGVIIYFAAAIYSPLNSIGLSLSVGVGFWIAVSGFVLGLMGGIAGLAER